jgi:hypothetical protein
MEVDTMRVLGLVFLATVCILLAIPRSTGQDPPSPERVISRAVAAHGGKEKIQQLLAYRLTARGVTKLGTEELFDCTCEFVCKVEKTKKVLTVSAKGFTHQIVTVFNGTNAWRKVDSQLENLGKDGVADNTRDAYEAHVAQLYTLIEGDNRPKLEAIDDATIDGSPAYGILVRSEGQRDIRLYFDMKSLLLVKTARVDNDEGKQILVEHFLSDYRDHDGLKLPFKKLIQLDGKFGSKVEVVRFDFSTAIEDSEFNKP